MALIKLSSTDRVHKERFWWGGLVDEGAVGGRGSGPPRDRGHRKRVGNPATFFPLAR